MGAGKRRESWFRLLASFRSRVVNELSKSREVDVRRGKDQRERTNSDLPWFCCLLFFAHGIWACLMPGFVR